MKLRNILMAGSAFLALALPSLASAEICGKIDYTFDSQIMDQVRLYAAHNYVYASDAACVLKRCDFASTQEEVGRYLAGQIVDPENIDLLINAVTFQSTKDAITQAALSNAGRRPPAVPPVVVSPAPVYYPQPQVVVQVPVEGVYGGVEIGYDPGYVAVPPPVYYPQQRVVSSINMKIDYTFASKIMDQVRLYLGDALIYADDAAAIVDKCDFASTQAEVGAYLATRLADPENIDLLVNAADFLSGQEAIRNAALGR